MTLINEAFKFGIAFTSQRKEIYECNIIEQ